MSDHTTQGGTDWELKEAENAIVAAGHDPAALAVAQRRHADAIRNMMQGAMVPSFVDAVERLLRQSDAQRSAEHKETLTALEENGALLGKLDARVGDVETRQGILTDRVVLVGEEISEVKTDVAQLKTDMANVKTEQVAIRKDARDLRAQVNTILSHIQKDRQLLQQWREQHGDE